MLRDIEHSEIHGYFGHYGCIMVKEVMHVIIKMSRGEQLNLMRSHSVLQELGQSKYEVVE